jgi:hypothetical protein
MKNNEKQWIQSKYKSSYLLLAEIFSCLPSEAMYGEKFMETVLIYFGLPIPSQSCLSKWSRRYFKENINSSNRERRYKLIQYLDRGKILSNIKG